MKVLPKTYTIKVPNAFERAAAIPPKVFDKIPTPLHVPSVISMFFVAMWTLQQIPLLLQAVFNLFRSDERKITVIRYNEDLKKESEVK